MNDFEIRRRNKALKKMYDDVSIRLISEILEDLKWAEYKILEINRQVALRKLIKKYEKRLKDCG